MGHELRQKVLRKVEASWTGSEVGGVARQGVQSVYVVSDACEVAVIFRCTAK